MNTHKKAFWFRAGEAFKTMVPSSDDRRWMLGKFIDDMKLPREVVDKRFAQMWAKTMVIDADFNDILAAFAHDLLRSRIGDREDQAAYDDTVAEVIHELIKIALNNPEASNVH